jgi:hypothetical protein
MSCFESSATGVFLRRIGLSAVLFLASFSVNAQVFFNDLEDSLNTKHWIGLQTIDSGFAHSGRYFSRVDSLIPYGLGLESRFPASVQNKNVRLKVSGWVKSEVPLDEALFVLSLKEGSEDLLWKGIELAPLITAGEQWFYFSDSLNIPANVSATGLIKAYLWNNDGKHRMGIDDLKFEFTVIQNPTFFPEVSAKASNASLPDQAVFAGSYYKIFYQKKDKSLRIVGRDGSTIVKNIWYFSEQIRGRKRKVKESALQFKTVEISGDRSELFLKGKDVEVVLVCRENSPEIQFKIQSSYKKNQEFARQSLVLKSGQAVEEVYRKNRKADVKSYQDEYWLDKEGVRFGSKQNSLIVYHMPGISSLQLKPADSLLLINLDYEKDHPFLHFPLDNDTVDLKEDWSSSKYSEDSNRQFEFSVFVGTRARNLPRFMKNPNGFLATYIWTEHADWTDIRTNRAAYFGSENIVQAEDANGGFVFYNIPVTKSVFWDNPDEIRNTNISGGKFNSKESSIMADTSFYSFLQEIYPLGNEICLHTPEQFTTTPQRLETALQFMQDKFASPSWIDHGYNNKIQNNREDLICDGSVKESAYFALGLWEKYGVKYLWNAYYEEYFPFTQMRFSNNLEKPYSGFGDFYPKPDYWQHPSRTASVYHWPTASVLFVSENRLWDYYFGEKVLRHFVNDWAVEINHCYPAWTDPKKGFWIWSGDSTIIAAPGFNRTLQRMAALRDEGKLNVTTIRDFMDYQLALEQIKYEILADGAIRITNLSNKEIKGLSLATHSLLLLVNGVPPSQKIVGDDVVFWFDLWAGESKTIRVFE